MSAFHPLIHSPSPLQPDNTSGLEVTAGLCAAGHCVVMACRSMERCSAAKAALDARPGLLGSCECRQLDLGDYASIRRFAAELAQRPPAAAAPASAQPAAAGASRQAAPQLDVLVNNAGVMGAAEHMRPNVYGPYLLTRLLQPLMAPGGRVVAVASEAHRRGTLQVTVDTSSGRRHMEGGTFGSNSWYAAYAQSKLGNVLLTAALARRLQQRGSSVTTSSVSPGRVNTNIFGNVPGVLQPVLRWLAAGFFQTPAQGARTVLHAALAPELQKRRELYLHACKPCTPSAAARDERLADELWELSNEEVGLSTAEDAALWPPH